MTRAAPVEAFRARRPSDFTPVSLGYRTVDLVRPEEIEGAQRGYAADPAGHHLSGFRDGDWSPSWLVIATEDLTGDPIFVDTAQPNWPVYTAAQGEGRWVPEAVADSFPGFLAALEAVRILSHGRETPVALEQRPISAIERDQFLTQISANNPQSELAFWETWLESS